MAHRDRRLLSGGMRQIEAQSFSEEDESEFYYPRHLGPSDRSAPISFDLDVPELEVEEEVEESNYHDHGKITPKSTQSKYDLLPPRSPARALPPISPSPLRRSTRSSNFGIQSPLRSKTLSFPSPDEPRAEAFATPNRRARKDDPDTSIQVDDADEQDPPQRSLRKRTMAQTNPYKFAKIKHDMSMKTGKAASTQKVESALTADLDNERREASKTRTPRTTTPASTKGAPKSKNKRARNSRSQSRNDRSESILSTSQDGSGFDSARCTLRLWLDGFPDAAIPVPLNKCETLEDLLTSIHASWGPDIHSNGGIFAHAIAKFPWLEADANIFIRAGLTDSFRRLMDLIEQAPVWGKGNNTDCVVDIKVFARARASGTLESVAPGSAEADYFVQ